MPTRRQVLLGAGNLIGGSAFLTGAYSGMEVAPASNLRVVADPRLREEGIELRPGRSDEAYVETNEEGLVTAINVGSPHVNALSKGAKTSFENIVEIHKLPPGPPVDAIYFEFEVFDEGLDPADPTPAEIEDALFIAAADGDLPGDGSHNYLQETDEGDAHNDLLSPNQHVPFGVGIDLLSSGIADLPSPERYGIDLHITAEHLPQGPPGGPG